MQRRLSSTPGAMRAPVGHATMHRVQAPHDLREGSVGGSSTSTSIAPSRTQDPSSGVRMLVFLPYQPRPARAATARSTTGPLSTLTLARTGSPNHASSRWCSACSFSLTVSW